MIFHYWKDSCHSDEHGLWGADWVNATWICRRWREVALETPTLWSSVLVCPGVMDDPTLKIQLNRARGTALDMFVSDPKKSTEEVEEALGLVLAKKSPVKKLRIHCREWPPAVDEFLKAVGASIVSLSIDTHGWADAQNRWPFGSDVFPRLRHLALCMLIPSPNLGALLLNLTRLELKHIFEDDNLPPGRTVHRFLAACPNLEVLQMENCFAYEDEDMIDHHPRPRVAPVIVTLPKLRSLSIDQVGVDTPTALGMLRLPALSSFHIVANCANERVITCDFPVIPQNITEALPPMRHSRAVALTAGGDAEEPWVCLRGGPGDTLPDASAFGFGNGDDNSWSVMVSGLVDRTLLDTQYLHLECCIRELSGLFLARIPCFVVPSSLVRLELHLSNGLPVVYDWARFFAAMPRLRTLAIGAGALICSVLAAFGVDEDRDAGLRLCPELEGLELCVGFGLDVDLAELILRTFGTWVRGRATPLRSLTVQTPKDPDNLGSDASESDSDCSSDSDSSPHSDEDTDDSRGAQTGPNTAESVERRAWKLCQDLGLTLRGSIRKVFLVETDCPACVVEYEPVDGDEVSYGELREGITYY